VYFKKPSECFCVPKGQQVAHQNILTFDIHSNESVEVEFWAKKLGFHMELEPKIFSFLCNTLECKTENIPDAYEKVLYDCIKGDQTLFTSGEEVRSSWKFITNILENWRKTKLYFYEPGADRIDAKLDTDLLL